MLQLFDTFFLGVTKHLTSLKSVLMFSLMLQGHIETNDWFQMAGRIRGVRESLICTPCPSNWLFLHSVLYLLLENMPASLFHPNLLFIPSFCGTFWDQSTFSWLCRGYSGTWPLRGTQLGHLAHSWDIKYKVCCSGWGDFRMWGFQDVALWKPDCLFIKPKVETRCLY